MDHVITFVTSHDVVLGFIFLAFVSTMPDELPDSAADIPDWLYGWLHNGLKTLISLRGPKVPTKPE